MSFQTSLLINILQKKLAEHGWEIDISFDSVVPGCTFFYVWTKDDKIMFRIHVEFNGDIGHVFIRKIWKDGVSHKIPDIWSKEESELINKTIEAMENEKHLKTRVKKKDVLNRIKGK